MRTEWAKRCNSMLEKKGVKKRVDPRSMERRAAEDGTPVLPPMPHFGKAATALIRKRDAALKPGGYKVELRVEREASEVSLHRTIMMVLHEKLMKAKKDLELAEEAARVAPAKPAGGSGDEKKGWPTHDEAKRKAAMRKALAALRGDTAIPLEWSDPIPEPDKRPKGPRGPQRGRERSR